MDPYRSYETPPPQQTPPWHPTPPGGTYGAHRPRRAYTSSSSADESITPPPGPGPPPPPPMPMEHIGIPPLTPASTWPYPPVGPPDMEPPPPPPPPIEHAPEILEEDDIDPETMPRVLGGNGQVKKLYTNDSSCSCCTRWSEFATAGDEAQVLNLRIAEFDIVHRFSRDGYGRNEHEADGAEWKTHSVSIRGENLLSILRKVFQGYSGLDVGPGAREVTFPTPFRPIVHRWGKLVDFVDGIEDADEQRAGLKLIEIFQPLIGSSVSVARTAKETGVCPFKLLWMLFSPGDIMVKNTLGGLQAFRLTSFEFVSPSPDRRTDHWDALCEYVDWNGKHSGIAFENLKIYRQGTSDDIAVQIVPFKALNLYEDSEIIQDTLIARGRMFEKLRGYHLKMCNGKKLVRLGPRPPIAMPVVGRVVVDAYAYYQCQRAMMAPLMASAPPPPPESPPQEPTIPTEHTRLIKSKRTSGRNEIFHNMTDEECLLANPVVKGFDLKARQWCEFPVDDLTSIHWNSDLYPKLVLPNGEKELALAFVKHKNQMKVDVDFVPGKGKGLVLLMFGPPGVGKTFTAEAVAEESRLPLYSMCAGDLGTRAKDVEEGLDTAFECCTLWNAILLLDEADVFLGTRTVHGLDRNELVSIFLRRMEQYEGTLFLTTNRVEAVDPAFQSRIDLILPYEGLSYQARVEVWRNFIKRAGQDQFDVAEEDVLKLAEIGLNGREIKNLIKSSQYLMMMDGKGGKVTMGHLEKLALMRLRAQKFLGTD